jgi:HSP20 family protein
MMTVTRFVPIRSTFSEMAALQNRLNAAFSEFARPEPKDVPTSSFVPAADVYEEAQA